MHTFSTRPARLTRVLVFCAALCVTAPATVWAQQPTDKQAEKEKRYQELTASASKKFQNKDYSGAIKDFKQAYSVKPVANIIYNIGRLYEKMGNFEQAVKHYEQFVNQPDIELAPRQDALARIKTLKEVLALRKKPVEKKDPDKKDPDKKDPNKKDPVVVKPPPKPVAKPDYTLSYVFLGTGVTSLVAGGVFGLLTNKAHDDFSNATTLDDRRAAASSGQTFGYVADGLFVAGGVFTLIGIVTYALTGPEETKETKTTSITPNVGTDKVTVDVSFRF